MGHINADLVVLGDRGQRTLKGVLVDTGATYTVLDPQTAKLVGVAFARRRIAIELGDGRRIKARFGSVQVMLGGRKTGVTVVSFPGAMPVIGVETLEALGLGVDPKRKRLTALRPTARALYYGSVTIGRVDRSVAASAA